MRRGSRGKNIRRWLLAVVACTGYLVTFACNSVYIPIPPPDPTFSQNGTSGDWEVQTAPDSRAVGARFYIYNATLGSGVIQKANDDGSMHAFPLRGQAGDHIQIHWERTITDTSATICRPLGDGLVQVECR
jgi:hypothetical protein